MGFLVYRLVMRLFWFHNHMDSFWPLDCNEAVSGTSTGKKGGTTDASSLLLMNLDSSRMPILYSVYKLETRKHYNVQLECSTVVMSTKLVVA